VYRRLQAGERFLGSLRLVVPLFLRFGGTNYDAGDDAGTKLDAYIRWMQGILERYEGDLIPLTIGDKGSFLYAAFGVALTHEDDPTQGITNRVVRVKGFSPF